MNDTPQRRTAKRFEPPPWERPQFDELAKRREQEQVEAELDVAVADLAGREDGTAPEAPVAPEAERVLDAAGGKAASDTVEANDLDEAATVAMLAQLRLEEPENDDSLWKVGAAFSGVSAVIGAVLVVWGLAALFRVESGGAPAMIGGLTLLSFGALFVGVGMWMAVRSLKQRGVL